MVMADKEFRAVPTNKHLQVWVTNSFCVPVFEAGNRAGLENQLEATRSEESLLLQAQISKESRNHKSSLQMR